MSEHSVQGRVTFADGKPAAGLQVRAVDCELRRQLEVGTAVTDAQGTYQVQYSLAAGDDSAKTTADLRVQVLDAEGAQLLESPLHPAAPSSLVVDLRLEFSPPEASEYERLLHAIEPRLGEVKLADIGPEDAEYLAKVTGQDARLIERLAAGARCAEALKDGQGEPLPQAIVYGLLSQGLPAQPEALARAPRERVKEALERAVADGLIPPVDRGTLTLSRAASAGLTRSAAAPGDASAVSDDWPDAAADALRQRRVAQELAAAPEGQPLTVADLFGQPAARSMGESEAGLLAVAGDTAAASALSPAKQGILAELVASVETPAQIADESLLEHGFEAEEIAAVRRLYALADLTQQNMPLVHALNAAAPADPARPHGPLAYLAELQTEDWRAVVEANGAPRSLDAASEQARPADYAASLETAIETTYRTAVLAARIKQDRVVVAPTQKRDLDTFFANNPSFEFGKHYVQTLLGDGGEAQLEDIQDTQELKRSLLALERTIKITDNHRQQSTLLATGLDSAQKIARIGQRDVVARLSADPAIGEQAAQSIFARAEHVTAVASALLMAYRDSGISLPVMQPTGRTAREEDAVPPMARGDLRQIPDLATLFGSLDSCDCDPCQSVLSPSAYFVDILNYLSDRALGPVVASFQVTPQDVVFADNADGSEDIVIRNTGEASIVVRSNAISTGDSAINWSGLPQTAIGAGQELRHPVTHTASEGGAGGTSLRIQAQSDAGALPDQFVAVSVVVAPRPSASFQVTPQEVVFADNADGSEDIVIRNTGEASIVVRSNAISTGDSAINWSGLPQTAIGAGQELRHPVTHTASEGGAGGTSLRIQAQSDAGALPDQFVAVSVVVAPRPSASFQVTPQEVVFADNADGSEDIVIRNTGEASIVVYSNSISTGDSRITWSGLPQTALGAGQELRHPVTHTASEGGAGGTSLRIQAQSDAGALPDQFVAVSVVVAAWPSFQVMRQGAVSAEDVDASQDIVSRNTGDTTLSVHSNRSSATEGRIEWGERSITAVGSPIHPVRGAALQPPRFLRSPEAGRGDVSGYSALDALLFRRPDLAEIELSCDNSDTPLLYLDLVLEILESQVGQPFPHPIALSQQSVAAVVTELNAGRVSAVLSAGIITLAPAVPTDASVAVVIESKQWTLRDGGRRIQIAKEGDALSLTRYTPQTAAGSAAGSQPQHFNVSAYAALASAVYPVALPFDLWTVDARHHLAHLGVPRHALMAAFYRGNGWDQAELGGPGIRHWHAAVERLGLSPLDVALVTGHAPHNAWDLWGISEGSWPTALTQVDVLLRHAGVTYEELLQLLDMRFVNADDQGRRVLGIELATTPVVDGDPRKVIDCDLSKAKLELQLPGGNAGLLAEHLYRMMRFVRLWRRLGWTMLDVDRALLLTALPGDEDPYVVYGGITSVDDEPVSGMLVRAIDQDIASENDLGVGRTDSDGRYRIVYRAAGFSSSTGERAGPNLILRLQDGQGQTIGQSKRYQTAARIAAIDLRVDLTAREVLDTSTESQAAGDFPLAPVEWTRTYLTERLHLPELFQSPLVLSTTRYQDVAAPGRGEMPSPYESVYLRPGLTPPPDAFKLVPGGSEIQGAGQHAGNFVSHIAAACGLSVADAQRLIDSFDAPLSLRALSRLYFAARAARVAGLSIWEFVELRKLSKDIVPTNAWATPESVVSDAAFALKDFGMPAAEAIWLIAHTSQRDDTGGERRGIAALLADIRTDLTKIAADATPQIDALDSAADLVREALLRLNWDAGVVTEVLDALSTPGPLDALAQDILRRHLATFDVIEHSVPLAWPIAASLAIPERLSRRCYYDQASGRLHFRGTMTVADYLALRALSSDATYRQALDDLRQSRETQPVSAAIFVDWRTLQIQAGNLDAGTRFALLHRLLADHSHRAAGGTVVAGRLASAFDWDADTTSRLIGEWVTTARRRLIIDHPTDVSPIWLPDGQSMLSVQIEGRFEKSRFPTHGITIKTEAGQNTAVVQVEGERFAGVISLWAGTRTLTVTLSGIDDMEVEELDQVTLVVTVANEPVLLTVNEPAAPFATYRFPSMTSAEIDLSGTYEAGTRGVEIVAVVDGVLQATMQLDPALKAYNGKVGLSGGDHRLKLVLRRNQAGNLTELRSVERRVFVALETDPSLALTSPALRSSFWLDASTAMITLEGTCDAAGVPDCDIVVALDDLPPVTELQIDANKTGFAGTVALTKGEHRLTVSLRAPGGNVLAMTQAQVIVRDQEFIAFDRADGVDAGIHALRKDQTLAWVPVSGEFAVRPAKAFDVLVTVENGATHGIPVQGSRFEGLIPLGAGEHKLTTKLIALDQPDGATTVLASDVRTVSVIAAARPTSAIDDLLAPAFSQSPAELPISEVQFPWAWRSCLRLAKIRALMRRLPLSNAALVWFFKPAARSNGWLDLDRLPVRREEESGPLEGLLRLANLARLARTVPGSESTLDAVFKLAATEDITREALLGRISELTGWRSNDLWALLDADGFNLSTPTLRRALASERLLLRLVECFAVMQQLGATAAQCLHWTAPQLQANDAEAIRGLVRARYPDGSWAEATRGLNDALRESRRDALVAHLVASRQLQDANDLYSRYLIDVEMSPCAITTRIKQACASAQLFVQRCLLNLEPEVPPSAIDTQLWGWMKNYRVWEATRKVFLYPENWIEPELRNDKSEIFRQLESELLQSSATHETCVEAFKSYVDGLSNAARLTVISIFDDLQETEGQRVFHMLGRDGGTPRRYFYRQWVIPNASAAGYWTTWEEVNAGIDSDHALIFKNFADVTIVWPTVKQAGTNGLSKISLNITQRRNSGWASAKRSKEELLALPSPNLDSGRALQLELKRPTELVSRFSVDVLVPIFTPRITPRDFAIYDTKGIPGVSDPIVNISVGIVAQYLDRNGVMHYWAMREFLPINIQVVIYYRTSGDIVIVDDKIGLGTVPPRGLRGSLKQYLGPDHGDNLNGWCQSIEFSVKIDGVPSYKNASLTRSFDIGGLSELSIVGDFVVEMIDDEYWLVKPGRSQNFQYLGSFEVNRDGAFTLSGSAFSPGVRILMPWNVEFFDSNYRQKTADAPLMFGGSTILTRTHGNFVATGCIGAPVLALSDRDIDCIVWQDFEENDNTYRIVPSSFPWMHLIRALDGQDALKRIWNLPYDILPDTLDVDLTSIDQTKSHLEIGIDFGADLPWSPYNWETFFHVPMLVATQLTQNQRFKEAQRWLHLVFDPTSGRGDSGSAPNYWRFKPFRSEHPGQSIQSLLLALAAGDTSLSDAVAAWQSQPFQPHLIARTRQRAYQFFVVFRYIENLIGWADHLFRRDTIESINEATQLYLLAAEILGPRPRRISPPTRVGVKTYSELPALDDFSNAIVQLESIIPPGGSNTGGGAGIGPFFGLYFCIPRNEKLVEYWDTVEDRLFKIRHCLNIEGIERQLALYEPPIDPAVLVRAAAAGLDIASVIADLQGPLPLCRFNLMAQRAQDVANDVKSFGAALLSALEKQDGESLALLRSTQELELLKLGTLVREAQRDEAKANVTSLRKTRELIAQRFLQYQRLLGESNAGVPAEDTAIVLEGTPGKAVITREVGDVDLAGLGLSKSEVDQLGWMRVANDYAITSGSFHTAAGIAHLLPDTIVPLKFGGSHIGNALGSAGTFFGMLSSNASYQGTRAATIGGHQRRYDEWALQSNLAAKELEQIDKQITAAELRITITEKELANHQRQIENARAVDDFMHDKFTNAQLYRWMNGQVAGLYFRAYQLAFDLAKRAEKAYRYELGLEDKDSNFIAFGYWDSLKRGLLAGEKLSLDIKRMEAAYLEKNKREFEITKHVSLRRLAPDQLVLLRHTGRCELVVPEWLFDLDCAGHYMRRLKSASLSVPCVVGPYMGVHCKLSLLKSQTRRKSNLGDRYARKTEGDDPRFADDFGLVESVVTSSGSNDSGLFETNLRDERYLPFEGRGAIGTWRIELPDPSLAQFGYSTISDVVLHLRYTARDGGEGLRTAAVRSVTEGLKTPAALLFVVREDFPSEWARAQGSPKTHQLELPITKDMLPYLLSANSRFQSLRIKSVSLFAASQDSGAGKNAGFVPLAMDSLPMDGIVLDPLDALMQRTGGVEPILLVELAAG